jgi:hypothetical protein
LVKDDFAVVVAGDCAFRWSPDRTASTAAIPMTAAPTTTTTLLVHMQDAPIADPSRESARSASALQGGAPPHPARPGGTSLVFLAISPDEKAAHRQAAELA